MKGFIFFMKIIMFYTVILFFDCNCWDLWDRFPLWHVL